MLPTGQALDPASGTGSALHSAGFGKSDSHPAYVADGASAIAVSPDKREMLVLTSGYNRFNGANGKLVAEQSTQYVFCYSIGRSGAQWLQTLQVPNSFGGIAWLPNGSGFVVGGGIMMRFIYLPVRAAGSGLPARFRSGTVRALVQM